MRISSPTPTLVADLASLPFTKTRPWSLILATGRRLIIREIFKIYQFSFNYPILSRLASHVHF